MVGHELELERGGERERGRESERARERRVERLFDLEKERVRKRMGKRG